MASGDISRIAFNPHKHYTSVRMQQGRVTIDDDWNENERIENEDKRKVRIDIIGAFGSPDQGFKIINLNQTSYNFDIQAGNFYIGGLRLEMESDEKFRGQSDWLQQSDKKYPIPTLNDDEERFDLVYLEAWQQPVSAVEDSELFEVALGGPDTSTRIRNMRRVMIKEDIKSGNCGTAWQNFIDDWEQDKKEKHERIPDTKLKVGFIEGIKHDLCSPSVQGGYLGAENQAIRVQLVDDNHFTWGFDNASPLYRVEVYQDGITIKLISEIKDQEHWPLAGQVVEILPWSAVLPNGEKVAEMLGHLSKIDTSYNPDTSELKLISSLNQTNANWLNFDEAKEEGYFFMRVWNRGSDITSEAAIQFTPNVPVILGNTGLEITISGDDRIAGDFWVIGARPNNPQQLIPWEFEKGLSPHGIRRFYAPLAIIQWKNNNEKVEGKIVHDCRKIFQPLTNLESCCTYSVGDGKNSYGDFNSLEEAVDNLPEEGGKICVLSGTHHANVPLNDRKNILISGCGERTIILPNTDKITEPIFLLSSVQNIKIDHLNLVTINGSAIVIEDEEDTPLPSREITIKDNHIIACVHAISIKVNNEKSGNNNIYIAYNQIGMLDKPEGRAAIFGIADGVLIERNRIIIVPPPDTENSDDPRRDDDISRPVFDPCKPLKIYERDFPLELFIRTTFLYVKNLFFLRKKINYQGMGGIQIGGTSERVRIIENEIIGGWGNGITLGNLPEVPKEQEESSRETSVLENNFSEVKERAASTSAIHRANKYPPSYNYSSRATLIAKWPSNDIESFVSKIFPNFLYEIIIEENKIQNMGLSGIGVAAYFSTENIGSIISVKDITIYRNSITYCSQQIPDIPADMLKEVGFGGIALSDCENAVIQENRIEDNGINSDDPICGIFILYGEKIDISNNRILNNGQKSSTKVGQRGGIVISMSFEKLLSFLLEGEEAFVPDGIPAIKINNNIVTQPFGRALIVIACGLISIAGNHFTTQECDCSINKNSFLAATVFIFNLGISKDLLERFFPSFHNLPNVQVAASPRNYSTSYSTRITETESMEIELVQNIFNLPGGNVLFVNNQTSLDLRHSDQLVCFSSQLIASLDDVALNSNYTECSSLNSKAIINTTVAAISVRTNDNRFQESFNASVLSLFSVGMMNTALGNQSTHCLLVLPPAARVEENNIVLFPDPCRNYQQSIGQRLAAYKEKESK